MLAFVMQAVLVIALAAACGALLLYAIAEFTPWGRRLRASRTTHATHPPPGITCPLHGAIPEAEVVVLASGVRLCPRCYHGARQA